MKKFPVLFSLAAVFAASSVFAADLTRVDNDRYWVQSGLKEFTQVVQRNLELLSAGSGLASGSVTADAIATGAVGTAEILDGTIVAADIATNTITSAKIADGTLVSDDISGSAAIPLSKLALGGLTGSFEFLKPDGTTGVVYAVTGVITNTP